ncbi:MAG: TRAP transporter substrate-binding protein DctP [Lachnospiraceae bacterium]
MKRKISYLVIAALLVVSFSACDSNNSADTSDVYELTFTGQDSEGLPSTDAMYTIAEEVEARTDGKVKINVYPANQLGDASLQYQGVMDGTVDMLLGYLDPSYDKVFDITTIPFLASNYTEIQYICSKDSNCYKLFEDHAEDADMIFLGFFLNGVNGLFSTVPLENYLDPDIQKGTLIRIANSNTYKIGIEAMGYSTITIPWSDTYTGMQTGIMDGMTGIPSYMVNNNFGDIAEYYLALDMFIEANAILISPKTVKNMPDEYVQIIREVCDEVSADSLLTSEDNVKKGIEAMADRNIEICEITDEERNQLAVQIREKIEPDLIDYFGEDILYLVNEDIEKTSQ